MRLTKLIITIPENKYRFIQELEQDNTDYATTRMLYHAVKHGKPYLEHGKLTNSEWIDFLTEHFDISRTSAKEMLHVMMSVKKEDNFKKQFSGRKAVSRSEEYENYVERN